MKWPVLLENLNKDCISHDLSPDLLFPPPLNISASFSKHLGQKLENSEMRIKGLMNQGEMKISNIPILKKKQSAPLHGFCLKSVPETEFKLP